MSRVVLMKRKIRTRGDLLARAIKTRDVPEMSEFFCFRFCCRFFLLFTWILVLFFRPKDGGNDDGWTKVKGKN